MELKILFYIVSIIIYFIYSANKASKKRKELQEQKKSAAPKQSWEDELKEILQKTITPQPEREIYREETTTFQKPVKKVQVKEKENTLDSIPEKEVALDHVPEKSELGSYQEAKSYDWAMYKGQEMYSVETDTRTLATHVAELEAAMEKQPEGPSVGLTLLQQEGFDARKAFLFSEIFRAKYVDEVREQP